MLLCVFGHRDGTLPVVLCVRFIEAAKATQRLGECSLGRVVAWRATARRTGIIGGFGAHMRTEECCIGW